MDDGVNIFGLVENVNIVRVMGMLYVKDIALIRHTTVIQNIRVKELRERY